MKKPLFLLALLFTAAFLSAQIPNNDMELWTGAPNLINWQTNSYPLTLPPWDPYIVRQDSDRYTGRWAADLYGNGLFKPWAKTSFGVNYHPVSLSFYYKLLFPPCVNDSGYPEKDTVSVLVELLNHGIVADQGYWQSVTGNSTYRQLIVLLSQNATLFDTCRITFTGGKVIGGCDTVSTHTEFKIDHLELRYSSGLNCIDSSHICDTCGCIAVYQPVCGCNGITYGNSCNAYIAGVTSWSAGPCNSNGCIDSNLICDTCPCPLLYFPVCGCNGVTYDNACMAQNAGVIYWTTGSCNSGGCGANFIYTPDSTGMALDFTSVSTGTYDSLSWNFGDGATATTGLSSIHHLYSASGLYDVCLTIFSIDSSCRNTFCLTLAVVPPGPCPDTSLINQSYTCTAVYQPVCGCDGNTYNNACDAFYHHGITSWTPGACFTGNPCQPNYYYWLDSTGYTVYFEYSAVVTGFPNNPWVNLLWNFGDGSTDTGQSPVHTYSDTSIHAWKVCVTVTDSMVNCTGTFCDSVRLGRFVAGCYAGFGYTIDSGGVVVVYPDSGSSVVTGSGWILGNDTSHVSAPTFQLDSTSNYNICYVVSNDSMHCTDTVCISTRQMYAAYLAMSNPQLNDEPRLLYLYPNPAGASTELKFTTRMDAVTAISVRDLLGEVVYEVPPHKINAGSYTYTLNLSGISAGVYLVEIKLNNSIAAIKKLVKM